MRCKLVAGNWKMHGSRAENLSRLTELAGARVVTDQVQVAVFPTYPYLDQCKSVLGGSKISTGSQDVSAHNMGAFTGEVSAPMVADFGCDYAIVGHSERRALHGETSDLVALKFASALNAGLSPILCVGETLEERESDLTMKVVASQVQAVLDLVGVSGFSRAVIAYEPVWAIGTGKTATPEQAQAVHAGIRGQLSALNPEIAQGIQILYGGSVKPSNAAEIFAQADVDGALVGGASLKAQDFIKICQAAG